MADIQFPQMIDAEIRKLRICVDRPLSDGHAIRAALKAVALRASNAPAIVRSPVGHAVHPDHLAVMTAKYWPKGKMLRIWFMGGRYAPSARTRDRVVTNMREWSSYADIGFDTAKAQDQSDIRINFIPDEGSYSYIGTDCASIPAGDHTMNLGWIDDSTDDTEVRRVVVHETGHALGAIHEHQSPAGGIVWNRQAVYAFYGGPPNNWSNQDVDEQILIPMSKDGMAYTEVDPKSIMMYPIPAGLATDNAGRPFVVGLNDDLSERDKQFISTVYPKPDQPAPPPGPNPSNPPTNPPDTHEPGLLHNGIPTAMPIPGPMQPAVFILANDRQTAVDVTLFASVDGSARLPVPAELIPAGGASLPSFHLLSADKAKPTVISALPGDSPLLVFNPNPLRSGVRAWVKASWK